MFVLPPVPVIEHQWEASCTTLAKLIALAIGCMVTFPAGAQQLTGSGSTFVYPIMAKWAAAYEKGNGVRIDYRPIGSSGGVEEIKSGIVDFGASDAPLRPEQLARDGLVQFPVVIGAIVPVVNLDGIARGNSISAAGSSPTSILAR